MIKKTEDTHYPICPKCNYVIDDTEDLGSSDLITYHGEDGTKPLECPACDARLSVQESVCRTYDTILVEKYYVVEITKKDNTKYYHEEDHTNIEKCQCQNKIDNIKRLIRQIKDSGWNVNEDVWYNNIKKMEIIEIEESNEI